MVRNLFPLLFWDSSDIKTYLDKKHLGKEVEIESLKIGNKGRNFGTKFNIFKEIDWLRSYMVRLSAT